jgi:hypothetical protein
MMSHLRRSFGLLLLLGMGSGCYDATFSDYQGRDAGPSDARAKADVRDSSRALPLDSKASSGGGGPPDGRRG